MGVKKAQDLVARAALIRAHMCRASQALRRPSLRRDGCDEESLPFFAELFLLPQVDADLVYCSKIVGDARHSARVRLLYRALSGELRQYRADVLEVIAGQGPLWPPLPRCELH
jgi:hypothetical protein